MKNVWICFLLLITISCKSQQDSSRNLNPDGFQKGIALESAQVLDVRTAGEFQSGHIKNALQANWMDKTEFANRLKYVDKDKPVYVYCLGGGRSAAAVAWMKENGFSNLYDLTGGITAWKKANKPVDGMSNEPQMSLQDYQARVNSHKTVLVDFGAEWCPPCVKMEPVLAALKQDASLKFEFIKIDAGIHTDLMKNKNIEAIPVFIVYKNGKETWRKEGLVSQEELTAQLK